MKTKDMIGKFCILCGVGIYVETIAMGIEAQAVECDRCHAVIQRILPDLEEPNE